MKLRMAIVKTRIDNNEITCFLGISGDVFLILFKYCYNPP